MKLILTSAAAAAILTLTSAIGVAQQTTKANTPASPAAATEPAVTVTLATPQKQGPTGQAILSQHGNDVLVTLKMPPSNQVADASIVHGACSQQTSTNNTQPSTSKASTSTKNSMALTAVTNGVSQTTVTGTTIQQLTTGGYSIIVRQTPSLCGDLNAANPIPGTQQ